MTTTRNCAIRHNLLAAFLALSATALGADQNIQLTQSAANQLADFSAGGGPSGGSGEWGMYLGEMKERDIDVLLRMCLRNDAQHQAKAIDLMKVLYAECVLNAGATIGGWRADGTLRAVEFDVWSDDPTPDPTSAQRLSTLGVILGYDNFGQPVPVATMYCYDAGLASSRVAALEQHYGFSLPVRGLFEGWTIQSGSSSNSSVNVNGSECTVYGGTHSNGAFRLGGNYNTLVDLARHVGMFVMTGSGQVYQQASASSQSLPSPQHVAGWYQSAAAAAGQSFTGDVTLLQTGSNLTLSNGTPVSGVVHATGNIFVQGTGTTGTVTLVALGDIELTASSMNLTCSVDGLLAWSVNGDVEMSGSNGGATGGLFATQGVVRLSGSNDMIIGRMVGNEVKVPGSDSFLSDGSH